MKVSSLRHHCIILFLALAGLAGLMRAAESARRPFDVPADKAERTLKLLAEQSGLEVLFATESTEGVRTAPVKGEMSPLEAARTMLSGTNLEAIQDARTGAITINRIAAPPNQAKKENSRRPGETTAGIQTMDDGRSGSVTGHVADKFTHAYLPGAEILLRGTSHTAFAERDGHFVLRGVSPGDYTMVANYVGYASGTFPVEVVAGRATPVEVGLDYEVYRLETLRVEGAREGQARALNEQRTATNIKNLVSADAIGNFPDVNAAAALKRIPGISTVRQRGEDRDITIRGAAPNLNSITIDGISVLSNQVNGRTVSMDVYPAEQLSGIEISKSATPDMDGDSIGGAINLRSRSAFDARGRVVAANAYWTYNDLAAQAGYRTGLNFSDIFGAGRQWGVQVSASKAQRRALEETAEPSGWAFRTGTAVNGAYAGFTPNNAPFSSVDIERVRTGGSFSLERKLGESTRLYFRSSYNEFVERNGRPRLVVQSAGTIDNTRPVTAVGDYLVGFSSASVRGQRVVNPREYTDTGASLSLGGETEVNDWHLELVGAYALGTNHQDSVTGQWRTTANTTATFDFTDAAHPRITQVAGPDLNAATAYAFNQLQVQDRRLRNREYSLKADASRVFTLAGHPLDFTTGFKARWSPKKWDQQTQIFNGLTSGTLALDDSRLGGVYEVNPQYLGGVINFGPTVAPFAYARFVKANLNLFVPNVGNTLQNSLGEDYYVAESIYAGYAMGEWTVGDLSVLAGARYERTERAVKSTRQNPALATSNPARYTWEEDENLSDEFLPGVHFRYAPNKKLVLRASWNNTLARPEANRTAPSLSVTTPVAPSVADPVLVSGGNSDLRSTTSMNVDFSAEYYLSTIGLVSVGYFYKELDGPIYRSTFDGTYLGNPARFTVYKNAGKAHVSGWEFSYQQQFTFLPGPLSGFGLYANYTLIDSEVILTEPGRVGERLPLFNQSNEIGNLALTFQKYGAFLRVSHNWRGDYLASLGNIGFDEYARGFGSYDLLASYKISDRWSVKLEATNLTNEPEEQYAGTSGRPLYYGDTGRSYALGLTFNY